MKNIYREILSLTEEEIAELWAADESELEQFGEEEQEWIVFVKRELSPKQRVFVDYFPEAAYQEDADLDYMFDKCLTFLGAIDLFERKPEFCPNASIEILKRTVKRKHYADDFAEIVEIMTVWSDKVRASKKPINRRAARMARLPKVFLYPAFVFILSFTFMQGIHIYEHFAFGIEISWGKQILVILIALYMTRVIGKAVLFKALPKNIDI